MKTRRESTDWLLDNWETVVASVALLGAAMLVIIAVLGLAIVFQLVRLCR